MLYLNLVYRPMFYLSPFVVAFLLLQGTNIALADPVDITADKIRRTADGVVVATGHVVIKRQWDTLMADRVKYRAEQHVLEAHGHVVIKSDKAVIETDDAVMQTQSSTGHMNHAVITLPGGERLVAKHVKRVDDQIYEAEDVTFSSCPIDEESWRVAAAHAVLDQQAGSITSKHARFELWHVPVLYSPWWQQSLKRKTGLLMPSVASGKRRGTELALPFYIAPQSNWDATLTPRWMSARGMMGEAEVRHASSLGYETINVAGIKDAVTQSKRNRLEGELRWSLPANMQLNATGDHVSDFKYIADYVTGNTIRSSYLQSHVNLSQGLQYQDVIADWSLQGVYQQSLLTQSSANILQILPRLESHMQWNALSDLMLHVDQQSTRFSRGKGMDGWRVNIHPYVTIPWSLEGGGLSATMMAGLQHTRYWLQQSTVPDARPTRTTAEVALEVRSDFEKIASDQAWRHVISPIVRYDYISAPNQSNLPNFDSGLAALSLGNLLSGNHFSGLDRVERTSRVSLLLENRLQFKNDAGTATHDVLVVRGGVTYNLSQNSIDPRLQAMPTRPFSNLLGEMVWNPLTNMRLYSSGEYNPSGHFWARIYSSADVSAFGSHIGVIYQSADTKLVTQLQTMTVNGSVGLGRRWQATGQWQYDMLLKLSQQTSIGLKYSHPCWTLGVQAYKINTPNGTTKTSNYGYSLLLEFKGLGSVGS